jgi:parallel beta-helix repeat protein
MMRLQNILLYALLSLVIGASTAAAATNTWQGGTSGSWASTGSWSRGAVPASTDTVVFNLGGSISVSNVPTVTIGRLIISNSTAVTFTNASGSSRTLTVGAGATGTDLDVQTGSTLTLTPFSSTNTLTLTYAGSGTTGTIAGTLNVNSNSTWTATGGTTTVTGVVNNAGTVTGSTTTLTFASGGKYQHNFTTTQGTVPTASWNSNSTVEVIGYTTPGTNNNCPLGMGNQSFGNFIWNCPNQTGLISSSNLLNYVTGDLTVASTGTGAWWIGQRTDNAYLSVAGDFTLTSGNLFLDSSGTNRHLIIGGDFVQNGGTFTLVKVPSADPGDAYMSVGGNLSINAGTFRNLNNSSSFDSILVGGNFTNAGTFTAGRTVVILNGSSPQTLTGASTFKNLTINNASGVTLASSMTVDSLLAFTSGNISTGANAMIIGTSGRMARTSGHVIGNLQMYFPTGAVEKAFYLGTSAAYTPATISIAGTGGTAGTITGSTTGSAHPQIATSGLDTQKDIERYWTLTAGSAALGGRTYTLRNRFVSGDVPVGAAPANFEMRQYSGSAWLAEPAGTYTRTDTSTQVSGLTAFSDFVVGEQAAATPTISGNAGIASAVLSYTDGTPKTATADGSGNYSFTVSYNWSGTVTPSLAGYTFAPPSITYTNVTANQISQNYTATAITPTISGSAGIAGAVLSYTDGTPKTATADGSGNYSFTVSYNWSGTVTPSLAGYTFTPTSRPYTNITTNQTAQNYTAAAITPTISGSAGVAGATLSYTDGTPKTATADGSGNYSFTVSYNWSGTVTPSLTGYTFTPTSITYTNVITNQTAQNYTAAAITPTISGNAGIAGATLSYTDGTPKTATADGSGNYAFTVSYNWSGTVTPSLVGYTFTPPSITYSNVITNQTGQNYTAAAITPTISGNAGIAGATLSYTDGSPKTATADGSGNYTFTVGYNWSGTVTPSLAGYTFTPTSITYANVITNQTGQNYTAAAFTPTISGNAGIAGATLSYTDGSPKTATADGSGNYSFTVSYSWSGTVTPSLAGYTFTPTSITYTNVLTNQTGQNYTATGILPLISGNAGIGGAVLSYTDGSPKTATAGTDGAYSFAVSYNWSGTVTPSLAGYTFTPPSIVYSNVITNQTGQNYTATAITPTISGNAGVAGAILSYTDGSPKTATADGSGNYSFTVSYNWSGTVTPSLTGYTFTPSSRPYTNVITDQTGQNYAAAAATLAGFVVEAEAGGAIPRQRPGTAFNIKVTAVDGDGHTLTSFTGSVNITSSGTLSAGGGATANFVAGVLASHSVTLTSGGIYTITATKPATLETGTSASFTVSRIFFASKAGNDATGDGTQTYPFLTIGKGVTTAIAGDTVQALAGTYVEAVNVTKSLVLLGSGASTTTIEAPADFATSSAYNYSLSSFTTERAIVHIGTTSPIAVTMKDFTVDGKSRGPALAQAVAYSGILAEKCTVSVVQNTVRNILPSDPGSVRDPDGSYNGRGIHVRGSGSVAQVSGNTLEEINRYHILINAADDLEQLPSAFPYAVVNGNTLTGKGPYEGGQKGIWYDAGAWGTIAGNTITNLDYTDAAVEPDRASAIVVRYGYIDAAHHRLISNNMISSTSWINNKGIYLQGTGDTVLNNTIAGYRWGIEVHDGDKTKILKNTITGGLVGVLVTTEHDAGTADSVLIGGSLVNKNTITGQDIASGGFAIALSFRDPADEVTFKSPVPVDARYNDFGVYTEAEIAARIWDRADTTMADVDVVLYTPFYGMTVANVKAYLQGPYAGSGTMTTLLRATGYIPLTQPYSVAPWSYTGTESVTSIPAGVVDWVLVELRTGTAAATRVGKRAAFLKSDGTIVDVDGTSAVTFGGVAAGNYYVVVRHRNHIPVMSAATTALSSSSTQYDFTTGLGKYYGGEAKALTGGGYGLIAGDVTGDGAVVLSGELTVIRANNLEERYDNADVDMDGAVVLSAELTVVRANNLYESNVP